MDKVDGLFKETEIRRNVSVVSALHGFQLKTSLVNGILDYGPEAPSLARPNAIPTICMSRDIIIQSMAGSGKTVAFSIVILQAVNTAINEIQDMLWRPKF
ncbi:RNA helicase [Aspergillus tanneri]|uniref:RNA helicase n=1 Tax=Aspergillus tanneri TaxID=1220188 RepID=A0A5M9MDQ3_9EURO|nr:RNA helicase [Aspergillus tanneri]KAA8645088.1 RNA helicase [Aspergillus tanneri]